MLATLHVPCSLPSHARTASTSLGLFHLPGPCGRPSWQLLLVPCAVTDAQVSSRPTEEVSMPACGKDIWALPGQQNVTADSKAPLERNRPRKEALWRVQPFHGRPMAVMSG